MTVFFLGFSSGFPFALTASAMLLRLTESGISIKSVGLFALISSAYTFKTFWAPLLDTVKLPFFQKLLGRRRGWILFTQILLIAFILLFGAANPVGNIILFAAIALCIAFLSATQDIVIDAYRIERISTDLQPIGASAAHYGWQAGAFLAGVLTLVVAEKFSWSVAYYAAALCMVVGILTILLSQEPSIEKITRDPYKKGLEQFLIKTFVLPLKDLLVLDGIFYILAFIILFKLGDAMAGVMTTPFLSSKGFTKIEMAAVVKTFGMVATLVGVSIGGFLAYRLPLRYSLLIAGILQMISNLLFIYQDHMGHDITALMITITGENLSTGIGGPIFITYLSSLCNVRFAAAHYALLASLASLARNILSSLSGFIVAPWGWSVFFLISTLAALPALLLLPKLTFFTGRRTSKPAS
jgi:PAT family beta-lactamase induction signal transducer AmpG